MTRPFRISVGPSRLQTHIERKKFKWKTLVKKLSSFDIIDISYKDYLALPKDEQAALKDVGYFIGGQFNDSSRLLENMARRCCITLDIDHIDWLDLELIHETYFKAEYVVHSTLKHSDDSPRLRLVFPLAKDIHPDKYEPVARKIAEALGMERFDDTTFQPARIMFWPAVTNNGDIYKEHNKGAMLDAEDILTEYDDWTDFGEWPHSSRVKALRPSTLKAEDPLTKPGVIGAFNRTFDIHAAIQRFELPYEATDYENRYRPDGATGPSGAVVYDDVFMYSHHESDAVGQQNVNAWDLVRIHLFGEQDILASSDKLSVMQWPSSKEMVAMALNIPEVYKELAEAELQRINGEDRSADRLQGEPSEILVSDQSTLTFDSIAKSIAKVTGDDKPAIEQILNRMAAARLDPFEADQLAGQLKDTAKIPKTVTLKTVEARSRSVRQRTGEGVSRDLQRELISAVLDEHYAGGKHLKRIGKVCWRYLEGKWSIVSDEPVRGRVGRTFTRIKEERPKDAMHMLAEMEDAQTSTLVNQITQLMLDDLSVKDDYEDPLKLMRSISLPIINCKNVQLQFNAKGQMRIRDHRPEDFYTVRIETEYDSEAKCPQWDRFMGMVFSDSGDPVDAVRHFEELGGYLIQMSRWLKTWVMLYGPRDTGKSTAVVLLQEMLGASFLTKAMAIAGKGSYDFEEQMIIGKLLMVDDDFPAGGSLPDGFMKKYSEEKPATANIKFGDALNFRARCLPMLLTNHWPIVHDTTPAFLDRALVIPFTYRIAGAEKDDQARAAMMLELPGVLNRFVAGLKRLRKRGDWDIPLTCYEAKNEWTARANPFLSFIADCLDTGLAATQRVERGALYDAFFDWYGQQTGGKAGQNVMHRRSFYERMREQFGEMKSQGQFYFLGIRITEDAPLRVNELKVISSDGKDDWDDV